MQTLSQFFDDIYSVERAIKPSTERQFRLAIASIDKWNSAHVLLSDLSDSLVSRWLAWESSRISAATVKSKRTHLLCVWRYASEEHGLCDPPRRVRKIVAPGRCPDAWTLAEMRKMIAAAKAIKGCYPNGIRRADWWELFIRSGYDTALRLSDLLSLPVEVAKMQQFSITQAKSGRVLVRRLRPDTLEVAARTLHVTREMLLPWNYRREALWGHWKRHVLIPANIPPTRRNGPQKLRRTSASHLERIAPGSAQKHLGHSTPGLAGKHYIDPSIAGDDPPLPPQWGDCA